MHTDDQRALVWDLTTTSGLDLIANGDFSVDANWVKGDHWSIANNYAKYAQYKPVFNANSTSVVHYGNDTITINGHNFSDGDEVTYLNGGGVNIGGLTTGTNYFIVNSTTNTFKLAATSGGTSINFTAPASIVFNGDTEKDTTDDKIVFTHPFSNGDKVTYNATAIISGNTDIGGLVTGTDYFVINATASDFQLAATSGGSAIDLTPDLNVSFDPNGIVTSPTTNTVTVANVGGVNKFHFNGVTAPTLTLIRGTTYTFDMSDVSNTNHPLIFQENGISYTSGVTTTGVAGQPGASVTFAVPLTAPDVGLTYLCSIHGAAMGNTITTVANAGGPIDYATETITIVNHGLANGNEVTYSNGGGTDIGGLTTGTNYFVIGATTDTFQLAATSGGSAINLTNPGGSLGTNHSFDLVIGQSHILELNIGSTHQLQKQNFGNLTQVASGLVAIPDEQDTHDLSITLLDPNSDVDDAVTPNVSVKVTGVSSTTELVNQTLSTGVNSFRFGADDTQVIIEIIPAATDTPDFYIDNVTLQQQTVMEPVVNAPINNKGIVVTEERFLMCIGAGGNSRKIAWSDKEDFNTWTAAPTNEAGDIELATAGQCMQAVRTRGGTIIITDTDTHLATYVGPPYVYSVTRIATNSGAVSRLSAVAVDEGCFWYGQENFFHFDSNTVNTLKCDVHDYVFGDFNEAQQSKVWGMSVGSHSEIWWFYCSSNSTEIDRYVAYDYVDGHWLIGNLSRTSGVSRGVFAYPFMTGSYENITEILNVTVANDSGNKFYVSGYNGSAPALTLIKGNTYRFDQSDPTNANHPLRFSTTENGTHNGGVEYTTNVSSVGVPGTAGSYTEITINSDTPNLYFYCQNHSNMGSVAFTVTSNQNVYNHEIGVNYNNANVFCETGPLEIGNGDQLANVTSVLTDEKTQGDVNLTFKTKFHPNSTERSYGPFNPSNPTSVRFAGRQLKMRVDGDQQANWKVGTMRLDVRPGVKDNARKLTSTWPGSETMG